MKLLLTSKGLNTKTIQTEFKKLLTKPINTIKTQIFYLDPKIPNFDIESYLNEDIQQLIKLGASLENIRLDNLLENPPHSLDGIDVVIMLGGNAFQYMNQLRILGLESKIKEFIKNGGIYIGRSAGAIIMGPDIDGVFFDSVNNIGLEDLSGLGYVDFHIVVHWDSKTGERLTGFIKHAWEKGKRIIPLTDQQAILVRGNDFKII